MTGADERVARLDALIGELEGLAEPARATAMEVVSALLEVYGDGLRRILGALDAAVAEAVADDEVVGQLLLVHDLHPVDLETRVARALDEVRPYLRSHGGDVELLGVGGGEARVRLDGSCDGCPSSAATLKLAIEDAILRAAPELERVAAEGAPAVVAEPGGDWIAAGPLRETGPAGTLLRDVAGEPLLFVRLDDELFAYRSPCPGCGASLRDATLLMGDLLCGGCGGRYDVRGAGRGRDGAAGLEPVPLLAAEDGTVRVALQAAEVALR